MLNTCTDEYIPLNDTGIIINDSSTIPDARPDNQLLPDGMPLFSIMQTVINTITLPKSSTEFALDLNGDEKGDNKVGDLIGTLSNVINGLDLQGQLDNALNNGSVLLLLEFFSTINDLTNNPNITVQLYLGRDLDQIPVDNFTGFENFGLDPNTPKDLTLKNGSITDSTLRAGPGILIVPMPLDIGVTMVTWKTAYAWSNMGPNALSNGILAGAIPQSEIDSVILPGFARLLNDMQGSLKSTILWIFDKNHDNYISWDELKNNALLQGFLSPDIDTDADGINDALSIGVGFTAVGCTIVN